MVAADSVLPIVQQWLAKCPRQPLVLRADPVAGTVQATIGLRDNARAITAKAAADLLGVSLSTFKARSFFGLKRGPDKRFSRLAVERFRDSRRSF
jgi:hypothetical protein